MNDKGGMGAAFGGEAVVPGTVALVPSVSAEIFMLTHGAPLHTGAAIVVDILKVGDAAVGGATGALFGWKY